MWSLCILSISGFVCDPCFVHTIVLNGTHTHTYESCLYCHWVCCVSILTMAPCVCAPAAEFSWGSWEREQAKEAVQVARSERREVPLGRSRPRRRSAISGTAQTKL